ncbi:MAG TPA: acetyl-CoA hydrolase/transferase C-terminal domain-containing protein [Gammaproteobacteria bacterium]|jgi:acyl-CoA hydrolase|nr:acetyl-CoA hydrolase/transferase C-terminal domain-containing protein [Gammaproteobacteria bacterium]
MAPRKFSSPDECVEAILQRVGPRLVVGAPLGIGKPNPLVNALYRRVARDPSLHLRLVTALSLERPVGKSGLERRFLGPFTDRVFDDYPELEYLAPLRQGSLPPNVEISEFYFKSGSMLGVPSAQRHYISSNYTHVARDMLAAGANVIVQAVAALPGPRYSLSSNPDVTLDIMPGLREAERAGRKVAVAGMVNRRLPFMYGAAEVEPDFFDFMVDAPGLDHHLFAVPNMPIDPTAHMIGLYASALLKDGGTLQVGIGSLGDACVYASQLRHARNADYRGALEATGALAKCGAAIEAMGGLSPYREGLYAGSEMFGDGLLRLYEAGILKRRVYSHAGLQALLNSGRLSESVGPDTLTTLKDEGIIGAKLSPEDMAFLQRFGILRPDLRLEDGMLLLPDGARVTADLDDRESFRHIAGSALGARLKEGVLMHGAFFLGSQWFYDTLQAMPEPERRMFAMEAVSQVNELFSDVELEKLQHRHARFLNICMKMTLLGSAVSDALDGGQVVSGVGGQYNFVAMAHALRQARSILMLRSTYTVRGKTESNILWEYAHSTIPRHLRDVVVTEYGIADLRGRTDEETIVAMLKVADSRFQDALMAEAKRAGKLRPDFALPELYRHNTPERMRADLKRFQDAGLFPELPFGSDFTPEELVLGKALKRLQAASRSWTGRLGLAASLLRTPSPSAVPYLKRMGLDAPKGLKERIYARLVASALARPSGPAPSR